MAKRRMVLKRAEVLAVAVAVCGRPPRAMTFEQFEQVCGKFKALPTAVDLQLRRLGYTRPRTSDKIKRLIIREFLAVQSITDPAIISARKQKLLEDVNQIKVEIGRPPVAWDAIKALASAIKKPKLPGWPWVPGNAMRISSQAEGGSDKPTFAEKVVDFLSRARTEREIQTKFDKDGILELAKMKVEPPKGYRLNEGRNPYQEQTFYLEQILSGPIKVRERIFKIRHSVKDPDYLAVIFPPTLDFTKDEVQPGESKNALRIFPIDSVFFGDHLCDIDAFKGFLRYLAAKPYAFAFLNGDIIGGHNYTKFTALQVREDLMRLLAPVAHKLLWAQSGPLEARMMKVDGVEPLQAVCAKLGIHHTDRPVRADVYWKKPQKPVEIYAFHGRSQARKDGAKANAIVDAVINQNYPHFVVMGHVREGMANEMTVRRLDPNNLAIKEHTTWAIICPSFLMHEGSEAEKKGYPAPAQGTVVMVIYADNRHEASS